MVTRNSSTVKTGSTVMPKKGTKTYEYLKRRHRLSKTGYTVQVLNPKNKTVTVCIAADEARTFPTSNFTLV